MENVNQDKSIFELMKKIADLECNLAKVEAKTFARKGSRLIASKVNDMQECIVEKANEYGKQLEFVAETSKIKSGIEANIIRNYTLTLERINKCYDEQRKTIVAEQMSLKNLDTKATLEQDRIAKLRDEAKKAPEYAREKELREQVSRATEEGDYEELAKIVKELQEISKVNKATKYENQVKDIRAKRAMLAEAIEKCEEEIKICEAARNQTIEQVAGDKEGLLVKANEYYNKAYLTVYKKPNFLQKIASQFLNKFYGSKRYTENVTNVLSKKVRDIDYKILPPLREKIKNETEVFLNKTNEITQNIKEKAQVKEDSKIMQAKNYTISGVKKVSDGIKYASKEGVKITKMATNKAMSLGKNIISGTKNVANGAKEKAEQTWNSTKNMAKLTYNNMLSKYRSARMWTITKMEEKVANLEEKQQRQEQTIEKE